MTLRSLRAATAALALSAAVVAPMSAVSASAPEAPTAAAAAAPKVKLTVKVDGCKKGCEIQLFQHIDGTDKVWQSRQKKVVDGKVTFVVPRSRTRGMSMSVDSPWNGHLAYQPMTVFRYQGVKPGTKVSLATARKKDKASGCWAGTNKAAHTIPLVVRKVRTMGQHEMVNGTIAWVRPTARTWAPMLDVEGGILGTQDVLSCKRP